jgi:hypothetical protein
MGIDVEAISRFAWADNATPEDIEEIIECGQAFFFQYKGNNYFIERGGDGYLIQDPRVGHADDPYEDYPYLDYPGHLEAKNPEEMKALRFLDGKTIFERFDELRFFG